MSKTARIRGLGAACRATALLLMTVLLQACGGGSSPAEGSGGTTRIVFGEQRSTRPIAETAQAFKDAPYDFSFATFATPSTEFEAFRSGALDLASSNDITVLNAAASGLRLRIVARIWGSFLQKSVGIVVQGNSPLRSVAGLKGRRIVVSTARGGSGDNLLYGALKEAGLRYEDVSVSYAPFNDALTAFRSGDIEVLVTNDPYLILAEQQGGRVLRNGEGINSGLGLIVASDAALADPAKRAAIQDVLKRLQTAGEWVGQHPDAYAEFLAKDTGIELSLARAIVERGTAQIGAVSEADIAVEQKVADQLVERGLWKQPVDVRTYFDTTVYPLSPSAVAAAPAQPSSPSSSATEGNSP